MDVFVSIFRREVKGEGKEVMCHKKRGGFREVKGFDKESSNFCIYKI